MFPIALILYFILCLNYIYSASYINIFILLIGFIFLFSSFIVQSVKFKLVPLIVFVTLMLLYHEFITLLPVAIFIVYPYLKIFTLILLMVNFIEFQVELFCFSIILMVLSHYINEGLYLQDENNKIRDQLTEKHRRLSAKHNALLNTHEQDVLMASLNERNRIAKELHDALGHSLSSSILLIESMSYIKDYDELQKRLRLLQERLKQGMNDVRQTIHQLYDTSIDLEQRIKDHVSQMVNVETGFYYDIQSDLSHEMKLDIISVVKECLTNVRKHSNATKVNVVVIEQPQHVLVNVTDNGEIIEINHSGMGLYSMKDMVEKYNGVMTVQKDNGFIVHITLKKVGNIIENHHR